MAEDSLGVSSEGVEQCAVTTIQSEKRSKRELIQLLLIIVRTQKQIQTRFHPTAKVPTKSTTVTCLLTYYKTSVLFVPKLTSPMRKNGPCIAK